MNTILKRTGAAVAILSLTLLGTELTTLSRAGTPPVVVHDEAEYRAALLLDGPDTIVLGADIALDDGTTPEALGSVRTIDGAGHTIDAQGTSQVFQYGGGGFTIRDISITGGTASVAANNPSVDGGAIQAGPSVMHIERVYFYGNAAGALGATSKDTSFEIVDSTFFANEGTVVDGGGQTVLNSTFTGNPGTVMSAGSDQSDTYGVDVAYSTFTGNGLNINAGGLDVFASVLGATTSGGPGCILAAMQPVTATTSAYTYAADDSCLLDDPTDVVGVDPELEMLADFGGPTPSQPPQRFSPLVDAIPEADCQLTTDQRGVARPQGFGCDIGAVELTPEAAPPPTTVPAGPAPTTVPPVTTTTPSFGPGSSTPQPTPPFGGSGPVTGSPTYAG